MANFFQRNISISLITPFLFGVFCNPVDATPIDHMDFTEVLKEVVVSTGGTTQVDYKKLQKTAVPFNRYLKNISRFKKSDFDQLSTQAQMAFLINAYNAFTLKMIVDNYPLTSVQKIPGIRPTPSKARFITLLGRNLSLEEIEEEWLNKKYTEPRVLFTLSCASVTCPALRAEAYSAEQLESQLEEQTKSFLRDQKRVDVRTETKTLKLAPLFSRHQNDFEPFGGVQKFISKYVSDDPNVVQVISSEPFTIEYIQNVWDLNEYKSTPK